MSIWRRPRPDGGLLLSFDHGPLGHGALAAHGHADALAIRLHWGEEPVLISPGTHLYHAGGALRDRLRGTLVQNTLAVSGEDQSRIIGPFAWARHAKSRLVHAGANAVEAEHDGYFKSFGLTHRRRVQCARDCILIEDRLVGAAKARPAPWSLGFTLAPGVEAEIDGPYARLRTPGGRRLSLASEAIGGSASDWRLIRARHAPAFGVLTETLRLELSGFLQTEPLVARVRIDLPPAHQDSPT